MYFFILCPLFACLFNYLKISPAYIWYVPNLLMIFYGLYFAWTNRKKAFRKEYIAISLFFIIAFIACFLSNNKSLAFLGDNYRFEGFFTYVGYLGFAVLGLSLRNEKDLNKYVNLSLIVASIICIIVLQANDFSRIISNIYPGEYYLYSGPFYHYNHFGYYLLVICLLCIYMVYSQKGYMKIPYLLLNVIFMYTFTLNNTFGAYLAYIFGLLLILFIIKIKKHLIEIIIILLTLFGTAIGTYRNEKNIVQENFQELFNDFKKIFAPVNVNNTIQSILVPYRVYAINNDDVPLENAILSVGTGRFELWYTSIKIIKERPLIGYGFENGTALFKKYGVAQSRAHNILFEMGMNVGIIGLTCYLIIMINILKKGRQIIKNNKYYQIFAYILFCSYIVNLMFGNSMYYTSPYFYILIGLIYREDKNEI